MVWSSKDLLFSKPSTLEHKISSMFHPITILFNLHGIPMNSSPLPLRMLQQLLYFFFLFLNILQSVSMLRIAFTKSFLKVMSEVVIQNFGIMLAVQLYRKRSVLQSTTSHLLEVLRFETQASVGNLKRATKAYRVAVVGIAIVVAVQIGFVAFTTWRLHNLHLPDDELKLMLPFGLRIGGICDDVILNLMTLKKGVLLGWMHCFCLYFCCICWLLREMFIRYSCLIDKEVSFEVLMGQHSQLSKAVSLVDRHFTKEVFFAFSYVLATIFAQVYNFSLKDETGHASSRTTLILFTSAWFAVIFSIMTLSASSVAEAALSVRTAVLHADFADITLALEAFKFKVCMGNVHLTVWSFTAIRRSTLVSVVGAFITYAVIILAF